MGRIPPVHALVPADAAVRDGLTKKRYAGVGDAAFLTRGSGCETMPASLA